MWRGVSLRKLALLLMGPMISEALASMFAAWMVLYAEKTLGLEPWQHMLIPAAGSLGYAASAFLAGRWVTPRWAPALLIGSIVLMVAAGLVAATIKSFLAFVLLSLALSSVIGHYYTPFQINMSHVRPFHTLAWSVAFYNIAWGSGAAIGPFFGSSLRQSPWGLLAGIAVTLATIHTILVLVSLYAPEPSRELTPTVPFVSTPRHRRIGLVAFLAVGVVVRGLYITLWPRMSNQYGWSDVQAGVGQFCIYGFVPLAAPLWAKLRRRLEKPWIMLASMVIGLAGFIALAFTRDWAVALACVLAVGWMESCVVFHAIYYMNSDPEPSSRGRGIGRFEMTAGIASMLGPVTLGLLAWDDASSWRPYTFGALLTAGTIGYVFWASRSPHPSRVRPPAAANGA